MDNPWATAWDQPWQSQDQHASTPWAQSQWPQGTVWPQGDTPTDAAPERDSNVQDNHPLEPRSPSVSDHLSAGSVSPPRDSSDSILETSDDTPRNVAPVSTVSDVHDLNPPDDEWSTAWVTTPSSELDINETQLPDQWETARQRKERLNHAVPPELLDTLLRHCQQVSQEIWPASEPNSEDNWRSGFDNHADLIALLVQLVPTDSTLPPAVQFSATATAKAMNEALKLTRHLPASANSPLSRLLASKGSLDWEKSIRAKQDAIPDTAHVGWRVLDKEDRLSALEESRARKAPGGLLSFWNRKTSAIQAAPAEPPSEPPSSSTRSSQESVKSTPHPPSASPSRTPTTSVSQLPTTDSQPTVVAATTAPSAVSRFLSRFSRTRGPQHSSLALSSDDLEFLSDIVPSANDPPDEGIDDRAFNVLTAVSDVLTLPPKLPPPIPPPPKQPILSSRPSSVLGLGTLDGVTGSVPTAFQKQNAIHTPSTPVLAPPLSPRPTALSSRTQNPTVAPTQSGALSIQQTLQPISQPNLRPHPSFTLPPFQKTPLLSIPPLLPPPPVSPPQTPRPGTFPSITPAHSSAMEDIDGSSPHGSCDSDEEFSAFTSFPPSAPAPFPSSEPYPSRGPPSPPSPPPRRSYELTHYPNSSSTSSRLSPASQTSLDRLCSTRSSISAPLDGFDDFISPPLVVRGGNRKLTPSPPPLPVKPQFQHQRPLDLDTHPSPAHHAHTPSQTFASPTVRTSLLNNASSISSVSHAEHQRTQSLVNHAAARGGMLWPNSPNIDAPSVRPIPPPPSAPTSPRPLTGQEGFDLFGDGDIFGSSLEILPKPLDSRIGFKMPPSATDASHVPFGVAGAPDNGLGRRNQLQPSPPPLPSTSVPILSFSSLGNPALFTATNPRSSQPAQPKQTGGLSAQDLSFFEGL